MTARQVVTAIVICFALPFNIVLNAWISPRTHWLALAIIATAIGALLTYYLVWPLIYGRDNGRLL